MFYDLQHTESRIVIIERIRRIVLRGSIANQLNRNDDFTYPIFCIFVNVPITTNF